MTDIDRPENAPRYVLDHPAHQLALHQIAYLRNDLAARRSQNIATAGVQNIIADEYLAKVRELVEAVERLCINDIDLTEVDRLAAQLKEQQDD